MRIKVHKAKNLLEKMLGLMFKKDVHPLYFETRWGVHTFFVRQQITILVLDASNKIVVIKDIKPNRIYFWNPKYKKVIEFPKDLLKRQIVKIGEVVEIES